MGDTADQSQNMFSKTGNNSNNYTLNKYSNTHSQSDRVCNRPINTGVSRFEFYGFYFRNHLAHFHKYTIYIRGFLIIRFPGFDTPGPLHCHPYLLLTYGQMGACNPLHLRDSKVFWTALSQSSAQYRGQRCVKLTRTALGQTVNCSQQP